MDKDNGGKMMLNLFKFASILTLISLFSALSSKDANRLCLINPQNLHLKSELRKAIAQQSIGRKKINGRSLLFENALYRQTNEKEISYQEVCQKKAKDKKISLEIIEPAPFILNLENIPEV